MEKIWKFALQHDVRQQTIAVRQNAEILHLGLQFALPNLWVKMDDREARCSRRIAIIMTGEEFLTIEPENMKYVGTFIMLGGSYVGHVFDCGEDTEQP